MKKFFLIALSCVLFSCNSDESEYVVGIGSSPQLNISEYTFSNEGDSIAIYSTIGCDGLSVGASTYLGGTWNGKFYYSDTGYERGYYGDWWYAACPDEKPYGFRVDIVVQPNDSGEERILPIFISYYDWGGGLGKFVQEK